MVRTREAITQTYPSEKGTSPRVSALKATNGDGEDGTCCFSTVTMDVDRRRATGEFGGFVPHSWWELCILYCCCFCGECLWRQDVESWEQQTFFVSKEKCHRSNKQQELPQRSVCRSRSFRDCVELNLNASRAWEKSLRSFLVAEMWHASRAGPEHHQHRCSSDAIHTKLLMRLKQKVK